MSENEISNLTEQILVWGQELGFQQIGISDTDLSEAEAYLFSWLSNGYHGEMQWMAEHGTKRSRPAELQPGTLRVISVRMNYWPDNAYEANAMLQDSRRAYISRYALGRDYHKLMRNRLQKLADKIRSQTGEFGYRVYVDSAPVLEKPLAEKSGLGWIGKHTNLINRDAGSWFFLGEIYTDLPLETNTIISENHCGTCNACIEVCPTNAIIAPFQLDATLCISYLTIELRGSIPEQLRPLIGNRIYGCDDCQLVCPWNRFARASRESDFQPRHHLDKADLLELFSWDEQRFLENMQGSAIRRIGYECWMRNIAVALGNAPKTPEIINALREKLSSPSDLIREHVQWALKQHDCS